MDKTYNNLMDIVSRTKKIDEEEGKLNRPKRQIVKHDEPSFDDAQKELKPAKTSLFEGKDAINKYLSAKKEESEKKKQKKATTTKKTTAKKSTTKKSTAKSKTTAKDKKEKAKNISDKMQLLNNSTVVKPKKKEPVLDMNDPKNVKLYNALQETLLAGGTDISEYVDTGVSAKKLNELFTQKKASKVKADTTQEQQEYERLFTGSFYGAELNAKDEEMNNAKLQEYLANKNIDQNSNIEDVKEDVLDNDEQEEKLPRRSRFDVELDEIKSRDREIDEKIADYYKRKQQKINEYNNAQFDVVEEKKDEREIQRDYESIFSGEIEKRSEAFGEENEEVEEVHQEEVKEDTFQSLYKTLNDDEFDEYGDRFITPASEKAYGETFVSQESSSEDLVEKESNLEDDEQEINDYLEDQNLESEISSNLSFEDEEIVNNHVEENETFEGNNIDEKIYDLSDEESDLDDYIVSSNIPIENEDDSNDSVMVISASDLPENKMNIEELSDNATENKKQVEESEDVISKQEFYDEMARLQENLLNELKGEKKEEKPAPAIQEIGTNATLDKALDIINNLTQNQMKSDIQNSKAEKVANDLIDSIQKEIKLSNLMSGEETLEDDASDLQEEKVTERVSVFKNDIPEGESLLNKDVALNESDIEYIVNSEKLKEERPAYFYMSEEDKEIRKNNEPTPTVVEESGIEVGDINLNKDIANAGMQPVFENETKQIESDDMDVIHTLFGIQKMKTEKPQSEIKVLYVTSECLPFIATGGLADVSGSLPKAINKIGGVDIRVIMPLYGKIKNEYADKLEYIGNFTVHLSWRQEYCGLFKYTNDGITYYFVDNERYFKRSSLYGFYDDGERFAYFCKAVVEGLPMINFFPDIVHCNDWQSALVSTYIKTGNWSDIRYYKIKNVYTIHNVEYQGIYGMENLKDLFGIDNRFRNELEYNGDINLTKAAIQFSDKFTTVSHSYCDNLKQPYCSRGLHHIIIRNEHKLQGILNGVDNDYYNPKTDSIIYKNYDVNSVEDKVYNKKILQDELGLPVDAKTPMIAMVSRLVSHKGIDLVTKILEEVLAKDVQFVVVGTGDQRYIDYFKYLENKYPTKVRALVDKYSNENARKVYAGSDIFLMPSKIEPCGISQMVASIYGSVPIVREVGGLRDSIKDFGCEGGGNGYTFASYNPQDLLSQINRSLSDYRDENEWKKKMKIIMSTDFSWNNSAREYVEMYKSLVD